MRRLLVLFATSVLLVQCALRRGNSETKITHDCIHDDVSKGVEIVVTPVNTNAHDFGRRQFGAPLRIVFNTDALTNDPGI